MPANMAVTGAITKKKAAISPSPVMIDTTVVSHGQGKPANIDSSVSTATKIATKSSSVRPRAFHRMSRKSRDSTSRSDRRAASSIGRDPPGERRASDSGGRSSRQGLSRSGKANRLSRRNPIQHGDGMPSATLDVLAIGNAIVDVLARVDEAFLTDWQLAKGSMRLIDEAEAERLYGAFGPAIEVSGGSAANTVAGVASLGGSAGFLGKVRDDQLGAVFAHDIRATGVRYTMPASPVGPATGRCLIAVTPDGERTMNTFLGASALIGREDIIAEEVAGASILYLEGYLFDRPEAKQAFEKAAAIAR